MGGGENKGGGGTGPIRANSGLGEERHPLEASAAVCLFAWGRTGGEGSLSQTFSERSWGEHWQPHKSQRRNLSVQRRPRQPVWLRLTRRGGQKVGLFGADSSNIRG